MSTTFCGIPADDVNECKANYGSTRRSERLLKHLSPSSVVLTNSVGEVFAYGGNEGTTYGS
ncbi:internal (core) protein [Enterobacter phage 01_vB_Eclo_IJM]|nr:internal (core) protein [Enterobacter phage 01_vB_Eclo_IJM]